VNFTTSDRLRGVSRFSSPSPLAWLKTTNSPVPAASSQAKRTLANQVSA
jgi:hypothetical protein